MCVSHFSLVWLFENPWTIAHQVPLSLGIPRQEYWSGLPFPSPGDLPNPGIEAVSPALVGRFFFFFKWRIITLQYCGVFFFLPYMDMNQPQGHVCPHPECPSHLPPHPTPPGCPRALALSALLHASNSHWSSISHMIIYMFQCYSLKSSHPSLHPQSPKVCSFHLCLFCYLAYRIVA